MFQKGIRLDQNKSQPLRQELLHMPPPARLLVPLVGCSGAKDRLLREGDHVERGIALTSPQYGVPAVAPVNATLTEFVTLRHPILGAVTCAVLETDTRQPEAMGVQEHKDSISSIISAAGSAGILDEFDGAPLYKKLKRFRHNHKDILVCCAADDDPLGAANAAVLGEYPREVLDGLALAAKFCGIEETRVLVENRREASRLRREYPEMGVYLAGDRYPARGLLKRKLFRKGKKSGFLGAQSCCALSRAVRKREMQTTAVITVTGDCVAVPRNVSVALGTPVRDVLNFCGLKEEPAAVMLSSSVSGNRTEDLSVPVCANTRSIVAMRTAPSVRSFPCIGCGRCAKACPRGILPWDIRELLAGTAELDPARLTNVQNCIACGACNMACPSGADLAALVQGAALLKKGGEKI